MLTPRYVSMVLITATMDLEVFTCSSWSRYFLSELRGCGGWRDDFSWGRRRRSGRLTYMTQACFRLVNIPLKVEKSERFCFCLATQQGLGMSEEILWLKYQRSKPLSIPFPLGTKTGSAVSAFPKQWELSSANLQPCVTHSLASLRHTAIFCGQGVEWGSLLIDDQSWLCYWTPGWASHRRLALSQNFIPNAPLCGE